jgi:capsular polysaccharide biosynthesis protein
VTDGDQTVIFSMRGDSGDNDLSGRPDTGPSPDPYDDFPAIDERPANFAPGLVSLGFLKTALRRSAWLWCMMAAIGFVLGVGLFVAFPAQYQAETSLLLTLAPNEDSNTAAANDQAMAQSRAVAALAVKSLGLHQDVGSFLASYSVSPSTNRVLVITFSAPSGSDAVQRANAVAQAFLQFRANVLQAGQKVALNALNQQITQIKQTASSLDRQITQLSAEPESSTLTNLQQAVVNQLTYTQPQTTAAANDSVVLDNAALLPHPHLKPLARQGAIGLVLGFALGVGIIIVQALVSDRLRRRDDVAQALGAPVKLSAGTVRFRRWIPGRQWRSIVRPADLQRIVTYLDHAVPAKSGTVAALAVVPVDDLKVPALSLVTLATSVAELGKQVVIADLCPGAPAAKLLGAQAHGVQTVSVRDAELVVAVPEHDNLTPGGPLQPGAEAAPDDAFTGEVDDACASADLLLTLVSLDPSLGGEHLPTWATDAIVMTTAGQSSWTKIQSVGEMIRLSGARLNSAILLGADKTDESFGVTAMPEANRDNSAAGQKAQPDPGRYQSRFYGR